MTLLIFCSQIAISQSKTIQKIVNIKDSRLKVDLKSKKDKDCQTGLGSIDINVTGGSGTYTYTWSGPGGFTAGTQDISNLQDGNYTLTVTDGLGCNAGQAITIASTCSSTCNLSAVSAVTNATACNATNGAVTLSSITGGSGNYNYTWYDAKYNVLATTKNITGLASGAYSVLVEDQSDSKCSKYFFFTIGSPFKLTTVATANASCVTPFTGSVTPTVAGGSGSYTYDWITPSGGHNTNSIQKAVAGGLYAVKVTDIKTGCTAQSNVTVMTTPKVNLSIAANITGMTTCSPANGAINISVTNGTGKYMYSWMNTSLNQTMGVAEDLVAVPASSYSVSVVDTSSHCTAFQTFLVGDNVVSRPLVTLSGVANTKCAAPFNGSIHTSIKGSNGPFSFAWQRAATLLTVGADSLSGVEGGDYSLTVLDQSNGCAGVAGITVADQSAPTMSLVVDQALDDNACTDNGTIMITPSSELPYTVQWQGPGAYVSAQEDINNLAPGDYLVTMTALCNRAPVVATDVLDVTSSAVTLNLLDLITDADDNLDLSTLVITQQPISGAKATISANALLSLDYTGVTFTGQDNLRVNVCDKLQACATNQITLDVDGGVIIYNAVAPNSAGDNKYMRIANLPPNNKVEIYNRWGDIVFAVDNYDNDTRRFTGVTNHGKELPTGTYFYKIEWVGGKPLTGYVALKTE